MPQMQRADPAPRGAPTFSTVINRVRYRPRPSLPDEDVYHEGETYNCMQATPHPEKVRAVVRSPASIPETRGQEPCWISAATVAAAEDGPGSHPACCAAAAAAPPASIRR